MVGDADFSLASCRSSDLHSLNTYLGVAESVAERKELKKKI